MATERKSPQNTLKIRYLKENNNALLVFVPGVSGGVVSGRYAEFMTQTLSHGYDFLGIQGWEDGEDFGKRNLLKLTKEIERGIHAHSEKYHEIVLVGKSIGGTLALFVNNKKLSRKVLWAPHLSIGMTKKRPSTIDEVIEKGIPFFLLEKMNIPTTIIHGNKDDVANLKTSRMLSGILPDAMLTTIRGADHSFTDQQQKLFRKTFLHLLK